MSDRTHGLRERLRDVPAALAGAGGRYPLVSATPVTAVRPVLLASA